MLELGHGRIDGEVGIEFHLHLLNEEIDQLNSICQSLDYHGSGLCYVN